MPRPRSTRGWPRAVSAGFVEPLLRIPAAGGATFANRRRSERKGGALRVREDDARLAAFASRLAVTWPDGGPTWRVVDGTLGALSFAHEFEQVTSPSELEKRDGAWKNDAEAAANMR